MRIFHVTLSPSFLRINSAKGLGRGYTAQNWSPHPTFLSENLHIELAKEKFAVRRR